MKKVKIQQKLAVLLLVFSLVMGGILLISQSYFNHKQILNASSQCYDIGGHPSVSVSKFRQDYSFECEVPNEGETSKGKTEQGE
ncbi:hypothetical protein LCM20_01755 [Halobacillus litoralis]|uniref:hypothetical protein n=1 Tax=Halobacillus litoralis TaxID=45668 RepID=UPI001CD36C39|nr:hypothetical protein [Halobacillus litoralis]MCA0969312.1 hypothetical protein [Halobacillus litoralis]